jgi:hypothetical protein
MKKRTLSLLLFLVSFSLYAQLQRGAWSLLIPKQMASINSKSNKLPNFKGTVDINIPIIAKYHLTKRISVGGYLGYINEKIKGVNYQPDQGPVMIIDTKNNLFNLGVNARFYPITREKFNMYGEYGIVKHWEKSQWSIDPAAKTYSYIDQSFKLGAMYFINPELAIDANYEFKTAYEDNFAIGIQHFHKLEKSNGESFAENQLKTNNWVLQGNLTLGYNESYKGCSPGSTIVSRMNVGIGYFFANQSLTSLRFQNFDQGCTNDRAILADTKYFFPITSNIQIVAGVGYGLSGYRGYKKPFHNFFAETGCNFSISKYWSIYLYLERQRQINQNTQKLSPFSTNTFNCSILYFLK